MPCYTEAMQKGLAGRVICLDPGHPSENGVGARGRKLTEVGVAWRVALQTKKQLNEAGASVILTKQSENEHVTNRRRAEIANKANADLMVRLHCDSEGKTGTATFYPDRTGRAPDGARGPSAQVMRASGDCARRFHPAMMAVLRPALRDRGLLSDARTFIGGKQGGALTGSIYSRVPVLLVELCVLSNPADEAFAASATGIDRFAHALVAGVVAALSSDNT